MVWEWLNHHWKGWKWKAWCDVSGHGLLVCDAIQRCGGTKVLWNIGILSHHYSASQPRRPQPESSVPWQP